ncbi:Gfo/Idh/MocA family protein [Qiania dongpingensis]|uniref:Gfo/Idh/MocA family oxidoreductase n=1 Tax=Qiania dongpingensis TaxID=2763669 RepID=A0A7G9G363_9FIRM|nr:Gfo/Idh/MocA family oxidoreductase [Qiania dongpingensis]QNM05245.1 Gfo/Idh/MocA family oxidoreductase [Qiania dongpingensis]
MIYLATIGSGSIVDLFLDAVEKTEGICCTAVYSRTEERAKEFAKKHGAGSWYSDLDAMLNDKTIDFIYVASPNSLHYDYVKRALTAGKHVICEKPFVGSFKEAEELVRLAGERGLYLFEAITILHMPNYKVVKEWLREIGPVRLVHYNYSQYSSRYDSYLSGKVTNVFDPGYAGGALMDINVYNLHVIADLFGLPETASYFANRGFNGVDCSGTAVLQYDGFVCTCMGAKDCNGKNTGLIEGEKGYILVEEAGNLCGNVKLCLRNGETKRAEYDRNVNRMTYEVEDFVRVYEAGDREACGRWQEESLNVMRILDQLRKNS